MGTLSITDILTVIEKIKAVTNTPPEGLSKLREDIVALGGHTDRANPSLEPDDIEIKGLESIANMLGVNHFADLGWDNRKLIKQHEIPSDFINEIERVEAAIPDLNLGHYKRLLRIGNLTDISIRAMKEVIGDVVMDNMLEAINDLDMDNPAHMSAIRVIIVNWYKMALRNNEHSEQEINSLVAEFVTGNN